MSQCFYWNDEESRDEIASMLRSGRIIAGSSDTVMGLFATLTQSNHDKLNAIKQRSDKPYLILIGDKQKAKLFTHVLNSPQIEKIIEKFWPGPLTIIVPAKKDLPEFMQSKEGTIALRVPQHEGLHDLLKDFDGLFSTSANKAGEPIPCTIDEIDPSIKNHVAALVLNAEENKVCTPSTILDCTQDCIQLVREGAISRDELAKVVPIGL